MWPGNWCSRISAHSKRRASLRLCLVIEDVSLMAKSGYWFQRRQYCFAGKNPVPSISPWSWTNKYQTIDFFVPQLKTVRGILQLYVWILSVVLWICNIVQTVLILLSLRNLDFYHILKLTDQDKSVYRHTDQGCFGVGCKCF